jgi:D-threo-aldose 1-dehydrogenase
MVESAVLGRLPMLGFGAAAIATNAWVTDEMATECLQAGWDSGFRYFDTAPMYGSGLSEVRLGRALSGRPRSAYLLSTKVGRLVRPDHPDGAGTGGWIYDFSADGIRRSLDESLTRLGVDRVDLVYLHDPDEYFKQAIDEAWPVLAGWRDQGVVGAVGVGMTQAPMLTRFIREADPDLVLAAGVYSLLDHQALDALLPAAADRGVRVVVAQALHGGLIDGVTASEFHYRPTPPEIRSRVARIAAVCRRHEVPTAAAALQFPLGHPAVAGVLTGPATAEQVRQNLSWMRTPMPAALWDELRADGLLSAQVPTPSVGTAVDPLRPKENADD